MKRTPRSFTLHVDPEHDGYALDLVTANNGHSQNLVRLDGRLLERLRAAVVDAVVDSKQPRTVLSPTRRAPIDLAEDAGIRLALIALAVKPVSKPGRVDEIRYGVEAMTSEEALYWFANCTGPRSGQALKALRILLAEE